VTYFVAALEMSPTNKINNAAEKSEGQVEVEKDEEGNDVDEEVNQDERGRGKRKRRESKPLYEPFDFTMTSHNATANASFVAAGRGKVGRNRCRQQVYE